MGKAQDARHTASESAATEPFHWPPRDQLPPGVTVESIRVLGTTWYERGAAYWFRRAWMAFLFAIADVLVVVIILAFADAAGNSRRAGAFWAVIAVQVVLLVAGFAWMAISFRRARRNKPQQKPDTKQAMTCLKRDERNLRILVRLSLLRPYVLIPILVLCIFFRPVRLVVLGVVLIGAFAGFGIFLFTTTLAFRREFGEEHEARTRLETELRYHTAASERSR